MYAIEVHNVEKSYENGVKALNGLSLTVRKGEIFSILGPNGSGKSTLIKILTTYLQANSGVINILEKDILEESDKIRSQIASVAQHTSIETYLSLEENLMFQASLYKIPRIKAKHRMSKLIEEFELKDYLNYPIASYSGGIKRRLDIALSMISNPQILFLDEPTVGMDIHSRIVMWDMMRKIRDDFGTTIFLTTHYLEEADNLSDTICIMKNGKEIIQATPHDLKKYIRQDTIKIKFFNIKEVKEILPRINDTFPELKCTSKKNTILINTASSKSDLTKISELIINSKIDFQGIEIAEATLEDIFLRIIKEKEL